MLEALFTSKNKEQVLLYMLSNESGYAKEIADFYNSALSPVQKQMDNLEVGGILYSRLIGRTRLYYFNPRYPFLKELKSLLNKVISFMPDYERERLSLKRRRPRRKGKPF